MINLLRQLVPLSVRQNRKRRKAIENNRSGNLLCPVCENHVLQFLPHGNPSRPSAVCPICDSKACHRLAWSWFALERHWNQPNGTFVHIAPEKELGRRLKQQCVLRGTKYVFGDLRDPNDYLDITNLPFSPGSIDTLFACHVINMLPSDQQGIDEVARVLRNGGLAVLQVPIAPENEPFIELDASANEEARSRAFNGGRMYRKYTSSFFCERLENAGFRVEVFSQSAITDGHKARWMLDDSLIHLAWKVPSA